MSHGEEVKTREDPKVEIEERGDIFFFYRPKVNREEAHSPDDVQRLYIVLRPESGEREVEEKQVSDSSKEGEKKGVKHEEKEGDRSKGGHGSEEVNIEKQPLMRFLVVGKKSLPNPSKRGTPFWGYVELVTTNVGDIKTALEGENYETATRGQRHKPRARALAEGVYRIVQHQSKRQTHAHLVYKLELPTENKPDEPQESLNIEREGSFIIQVKNPETGGSGRGFEGLQNKRRAAFPAHLQGRFGQQRFIQADPPDFLNYEGCEFLLISASDDIEAELGLELKMEAAALEVGWSDAVKMFGDVASPKPLLSGKWA